MISYKEKLHRINTLFFDIDGVFTNSEVYVLPDGQMLRAMHTRDGFAIKYAISVGCRVYIISGGEYLPLYKRFMLLGVPKENIFLGAKDKEPILLDILDTQNIQPEHTLYMGDDIPDLKAMAHCGIKTCPKDASIEIKENCDYISSFDGGKGCVRDIVEQVLKSQNRWIQ